MTTKRWVAALILVVPVSVVGQTESITIRAGTLLDGRGQASRNVMIRIDGARIAAIGSSDGRPTYDLSQLTVLPGLIDTHVHIVYHFGKDGRADTTGETPVQAVLAAGENAHLTLMAGFTTVQSVGAAEDGDLRDAIARGTIPGPRVLTSLGSLSEETGTPDQIRQFVRQKASHKEIGRASCRERV